MEKVKAGTDNGTVCAGVARSIQAQAADMTWQKAVKPLFYWNWLALSRQNFCRVKAKG